jgi:N-acetylmuramoyl-L-alanine amidase
MASIAFNHGFLWKTLWDHSKNHSLRTLRKDPNVLYPGDRVFIPRLRERKEECNTDVRHRFRLLGVPEKLQMVLLESNGEPRADWEYCLVIDGKITAQGVLDGTGRLECSIPPNAKAGRLHLRFGSINEEIKLDLGATDPIDTASGVQARLNSLGFDCGSVDGEKGPRTTEAIAAFQESEGLAVTGDLDDETLTHLQEVHGF